MNFLGYVLGFIVWTAFSGVVAFGITLASKPGENFFWYLGGSFVLSMCFGLYLFCVAFWREAIIENEKPQKKL